MSCTMLWDNIRDVVQHNDPSTTHVPQNTCEEKMVYYNTCTILRSSGLFAVQLERTVPSSTVAKASALEVVAV